MTTPENVVLLPKTSDTELLSRYYSLADAFVICSKKENFPTTCVEAQCCGTPVFGFDTGGTKETLVSEGDYFCEYGDIPALKHIAERVLQEDRTALAKKAGDVYSGKAMYENYLREYDHSGKKKRILLIDVNCKNSSTGKIVYELYRHLRDDGREAAICYGRGPQIDEPDIFKFGLDAETVFHAALSRITGLNGCYSRLSTERLIHFIREYKPDLVHIHELHAYFVNHAQLIHFLKEQNIPVVWTFHCEYAYTGKCGYAYDCEGFRNGCGNCPKLHDYPKTLFFDRTRSMLCQKKDALSDLNMRIVTPSQWLADRVRLSFLKDKPLTVIHNGINTEIFSPKYAGKLREQLSIPADRKIILALAPDIMCERKGGRWVLQLAKTMQAENVTFLLVGVENCSGGATE